jgi:hypothetical protein
MNMPRPRRQRDNEENRREIIMQGTGASGIGAAYLGLPFVSARENGKLITEFRCTHFLKNDMVVRRFYHHNPLLNHTFIVFQTNSRHVFMVHLIANLHNRCDTALFVEIQTTTWRPKADTVHPTNVKVRFLKSYLKRMIREFGRYQVGLRDCRHFSRDVAKFLAFDGYVTSSTV